MHVDPRYLKSYAVRGRRRPATCERAGCPRWELGWITIIDESTDLGKRQSSYIRHMSGRRFIEEWLDQDVIRFVFEPGQQCFEQHFVSLDVAPTFAVLNGGAGAPVARTHATADDWVNDLGEHLDVLRRERG